MKKLIYMLTAGLIFAAASALPALAQSSAASSAVSSAVSSAAASAAASSCPSYAFKSGTIEPGYTVAGGDVLVRCGYGADTDCIKVTGGGLTNCVVRGYANGETLFACKASSNPGAYSDVKCVMSASTTDPCCVAQSNALPAYTVISTASHFAQQVRIPKGSYTLSVNYNTVVYSGQGAYVGLVCASDSCGNGVTLNQTVGKNIDLSLNASFATKSQDISIPDGGSNKDYRIRIVVGDGSEVYLDNVSFSGGGKEYVLNGDFKNVRGDITSVTLDQPVGWGQGDNKIGYYYGMAFNANTSGYAQSSTAGGAASGGTAPGSSGTAPGSAAMKLNMKIKLQGVASKPRNTSTITVKVKVGGGFLTQTTAYQNVTFTAGDGGIWTGTADTNLPPGGGYMLYVKGPKHLQKKVCSNAPTEGSGGTYHCGDGAIALKAGDNTIDMSKILLLAGDLPENGVQNGIVDSYDTSFVRQHLQSTKTEDLNIGDLNYDGAIDGQDYSLVIAALSIKYDEE